MDSGKETIFEERRKARANTVKIVFVNPTDFNVVDEEGSLKYVGTVKDPVNCTCHSFVNLNTPAYEKAHPEPAKCKHIYRAEELLTVGRK